LRRIFQEEPDGAEFYSLKGMEQQTNWFVSMDPEILTWYLGDSTSNVQPGNLCVERCVLIGDLGPDRPFALDYRKSLMDPEVIFMTESGAWRRVAPGIQQVLLSLDIS